MSVRGANRHIFVQSNPNAAVVCTRCGAPEWECKTTCVADLPRCDSCEKPKAQSSADADSGLFCCKGFGTSERCAPYGKALQSEIYVDSDVIVTRMHTDYTGSSIQVEEVPVSFEKLYPGQYDEPVVLRRDIDAELGALVRQDLDTTTPDERYRALRKLRAENHRLASVLANIFAAYRAAKGKINT